jgi:hypothetical protein
MAFNHPRKPKRCRVCHESFMPINSLSKLCSLPCAREYTRQTSNGHKTNVLPQKAEVISSTSEVNKTRSAHLRELQVAFNTWIRQRDAGQACISCGESARGRWHAGHYRSAGSCPELRFEPDNVHRQCERCNTHLSGNLAAYRLHLVEKIGLARVEWLEGPHAPKKLPLPEIVAMTALYRAKILKCLC